MGLLKCPEMGLQMRRATLGLLAAVCLISGLTFLSSTWLSFVVLVPGRTLAGGQNIWSLITCTFVETNVLKLLLALPLIGYCGGVAELSMGSQRLLLLVGLTTLISSFTMLFASVQAYFANRDETVLFDPSFGTGGLCAALAVAAVQASPSGIVPRLEKLEHSHIPVLSFTLFTVMHVLGLSGDLGFMCTSFFFTWIYLRFWERKPDGTVGDARDEFAFKSLFPKPIQPAVALVARAVGIVCLRTPCFSLPASQPHAQDGTAREPGTGASGNASHAVTVDGVLDPVAERRRARAMKALDQRLAEIEARRKQRAGGVRGARAQAQQLEEESAQGNADAEKDH